MGHTYLHIRIGQPGICDYCWTAIEYLHIGVGHSWLVTQGRAAFKYLALIAGLFLELTNSCLLGCLAGVYEAGRKFDAYGFDWWTVLQDDYC